MHFTLIRKGYPYPGALDVAVSHAVLNAVSRGEIGGVLRLYVPGPVVAFGRVDRREPGYSYAVRAAEAHGFAAIERLAGGRAAVFHEATLAFSLAIPDPEPMKGTVNRFETVSSLMRESFRSLGVDTQIGELPGEYCPGKWSLNVGGRVKVMGVGQRLVRDAAHVGGVVVVDEGQRIRDVLIPVYRALNIDWDPRTTGSLADQSPGLNTTEVANAIISSFAARYDLESGELSAELIEEAWHLAPHHLPGVA